MSHRDSAYFESLKTVFAEHQSWLRTRRGKRADLSFKDLSGLNLGRINLAGARLSGANLCQANLSGADLSQADLFGADMELCNLQGANLTSADLRGANLNRAVMTDAVLRAADLRAGELMTDQGTRTNRTGATILTEARMERSVLIGANLAGADLTGADLNEADLSGAELSRAVLIGTDLTGANLAKARLGETIVAAAALAQALADDHLPPNALAAPPYRPLASADFLAQLAAHEQWTNQGGQAGKRLELDLMTIGPVDLAGRVMTGARLRRCQFQGGNWQGVELQMADLSYSDLPGIDLTKAQLSGTNFRRATLPGVRLSGARCPAFVLHSGKTWPTNFQGADLRQSDLTGVDLTNALTEGALLPTGVAAPAVAPRPERRRHRRYATPHLLVKTEAGVFKTRNWSIGGMSLAAVGGFQPGDQVAVVVALPEANQPPARATLTVVYTDVRQGAVSLRFDSLSDPMKQLLKAAFDLHNRSQQT